MRHETQVAIARRLLDHLDRGEPVRSEVGATIPAARYTSPEHLALEERTILSRWPQMVALAGDLPKPGTWVVRESGGSSFIVTRDWEGRVHAMANVCRHRGARVAEQPGWGRRLMCPYHAWSYHLDGTLAGVPDGDSFPDVPAGSCALPALPCVELDGTIWVNPAGAGADVDLGAFADDLGALDVPSYVHWRQHRFDLDLNWKLVIDTFLEPYHFASLHQLSVGPIFVANLCVADRDGLHVREVLPRKSLAGLRDVPESEWDLIPHTAIVYVLFPNTVFVVQVDHLETWRVRPVAGDPGRCVCELDFYIPADATGERAQLHWEKNWELTVRTVIDEDFHAMTGVQANLASGHLDHLTVGRNEPALAMYHAALDAAVGCGGG